jgi:hypothetical protein
MKQEANKHVIALLTYIILLPLVYIIPLLVMAYISKDHLSVTIISVTIIVPIISYIALPLTIRFYLKLIHRQV